MCCIIHRLKDSKSIPTSNIDLIIDKNPHGWGISYIKNGILQIEKSMNMEAAVVKIKQLEDENIEFLFHARYATHGEKNLQNCHPYDLNNGVMFHNGTIDIRCRNKHLSDTHYFSLKVNKYLRKKKSLEWIIKKLSSQIGKSRLAFMLDTGEILKFGDWQELDGNFYSKLTWKSCHSLYWNCYETWENCGYNNKTSSLSIFNNSVFEDCIERCKARKILLTYAVNKLTEDELITLAIRFPDACAEYIKRTTY